MDAMLSNSFAYSIMYERRITWQLCCTALKTKLVNDNIWNQDKYNEKKEAIYTGHQDSI